MITSLKEQISDFRKEHIEESAGESFLFEFRSRIEEGVSVSVRVRVLGSGVRVEEFKAKIRS